MGSDASLATATAQPDGASRDNRSSDCLGFLGPGKLIRTRKGGVLAPATGRGMLRQPLSHWRGLQSRNRNQIIDAIDIHGLAAGRPRSDAADRDRHQIALRRKDRPAAIAVVQRTVGLP